MAQPPALKRALSLPVLTLYGLGTIIGAGIYVLIGEVIGAAGLFAPFAFLLAGVIAGFTAFSYAELASRFPKSAAEAVYVDQAWNHRGLSQLTGWLVIFTGIISAAAMANGFVGYLHLFMDLPRWLVISSFAAGLTLIATWGIVQSAALIIAVSLLEIGGLFFVLLIGQGGEFGGDFVAPPPASLLPDGSHLVPIALGAFIAFYAFIGFEDMVNVAEEVKNPRRTMPVAILLAILLATIIYAAIALIAVRSMEIEKLAASTAPLADIVASKGYSPALIGLIGLVALLNGALAQIIMASRILYGMAVQNMAPKQFAAIAPATQTPMLATFAAAGAMLGFALWLPLGTLAKFTSLILLLVFTLINLALIQIKRRQPEAEGAVSYPIWVPAIGALLCLALLGIEFVAF